MDSSIIHHFKFYMPPSTAEMNGLDRLLYTFSMQKGVKFNIKNRLDFNEFMYCEGCLNPYYRGRLHGLVALSIPIGWYFILLNCETQFTRFIYSVYMFCNFISYSTSYFFHRESFKYGPDIENLSIKLDRFFIFLNISGNFTPVSVIFLKKTGFYFLTILWSGSFIEFLRIFGFNRNKWWEPMLFGATAFLFTGELYETMTPYEFWMTMSSYLASIIGGICFGLKIPDTLPEIWGYHEYYHLSVSIAAVIVYFINYSLSTHSIS